MLNLYGHAYLSNHSYCNKAHEIPDPVAKPQKCSLNGSEEVPQIASSHQASISASKARFIYISSESEAWHKHMFFLSLRPHKFPRPVQAYSSFLSHLCWFELGEFRLSRGIGTVGDLASLSEALWLAARRLNDPPFSLQRLYNISIFLAVQVDCSVQGNPVLFCEMKQNDHSLFD